MDGKRSLKFSGIKKAQSVKDSLKGSLMPVKMDKNRTKLSHLLGEIVSPSNKSNVSAVFEK